MQNQGLCRQSTSPPQSLHPHTRPLFPGHFSDCSSSWAPPAGQVQRGNGPEAALPTRQVTEVLHSAGRTLSKFSAVSQSCREGCSSRSYRRTKLTKASSQTPPSVSDSLPYWGFLGSPPKWTACIQSLSQSPFMENQDTRQVADSHWRLLSKLETDNPNGLVAFIRQCLCKAQTGLEDEQAEGWGVQTQHTHKAPPRSRKNDLNSDTAVCIEAGKEYGERFYWS